MDFLKKMLGGARPKGPNLDDRPSIIELLCNNELEQVAKAVAAREAMHGSRRGGFDWSKGMPEFLYKQADYLIRRKYPDLPGFTATQQKKVGSSLGLCVLEGTPKTEVPARMREVMGGHFFECVELSEFCRTNPCGTYVVKTDPQILYWFTRLAEAENHIKLEELKAKRQGEGIQICLVENDPCRLCKTNKTVYLWRDIEELPALPRHFGCRCRYEAFVRNK